MSGYEKIDQDDYKSRPTRRNFWFSLDVLKFTHRDVTKLRDEVVTQFQTNGNIYRNSLNKAEAIVMENKNLTEHLVHSQVCEKKLFLD